VPGGHSTALSTAMHRAGQGRMTGQDSSRRSSLGRGRGGWGWHTAALLVRTTTTRVTAAATVALCDGRSGWLMLLTCCVREAQFVAVLMLTGG